MTLRLCEVAGGVQFDVKVVPGASRDRIAGLLGDALKVQVAAPPEGGKANAAVCELLAAVLGVAPRAVAVVRGHGNARKVVGVMGLAAAVAEAKLRAALPTRP